MICLSHTLWMFLNALEEPSFKYRLDWVGWATLARKKISVSTLKPLVQRKSCSADLSAVWQSSNRSEDQKPSAGQRIITRFHLSAHPFIRPSLPFQPSTHLTSHLLIVFPFVCSCESSGDARSISADSWSSLLPVFLLLQQSFRDAWSVSALKNSFEALCFFFSFNALNKTSDYFPAILIAWLSD